MEIRTAAKCQQPESLSFDDLKPGCVYRHPKYDGLYMKTSLRLHHIDNALIHLGGNAHNTEKEGWILVNGHFCVEGAS